MDLWEETKKRIRQKRELEKADIDQLIARFDAMPEGPGREEVRVTILFALHEHDEKYGNLTPPISLASWMALNREKWAWLEPKKQSSNDDNPTIG
jgi:hypothetical protein